MKVEQWLDTDLGRQIWEKKYRSKNESFDEWLDRVSGKDEDVRELIKNKKFLFGGRTLSNRGLNDGSYSNCYSSGFIEDSLTDILAVNTKLALTYKAQGGQGVSLTKIRPKGTLINGRYLSEGIIPIMEQYNQTTAYIMQGGSRKGALMISIDITHKESEAFINVKSDLSKINKANLSLEIDNVFMQIVEESYRTNTEIPMDLKRTYGSQEIEYTIIPIILYKQLIKQAHLFAEPGVLFVDRLRNYNLMEFCDDYQIETVNPCGEQPLPKDGACNLGSMNVSAYVCNPFQEDAYFDMKAFLQDVVFAVQGLDALIDENLPNHAMEEQRIMSSNYRNIGLGIMGLADAFIKLGYVYGSETSIEFTKELMKKMLRTSVLASVFLAMKLGSFPKYTPEVFDATILKDVFTPTELRVFKQHGLRNCSLLSIAPTGTLGTMFNISTGIEPNFAISYTRKTESLNDGESKTYDVYCGVAEEYTDLIGSTDFPEYFLTSHDIPWQDRIKVQAAAQTYVDTAISSTVNLHKDITIEEVEQLYLTAWKSGLKGITIYRDGSRDGILSLQGETIVEPIDEAFFVRPEILEAKIMHFKNNNEQWIAVIGIKDGRPFEIFTGPSDVDLFPIPSTISDGEIIKVKIPGKDSRYDFRYTDSYGYQNTLGGLSRCFNKEYWNYARLVSGMLRQQVKIASIAEIVDGMHTNSESLHSWKNGIIRALKSFIPDGTRSSKVCACGGTIIYVGGCTQCSSCGESKCG